MSVMNNIWLLFLIIALFACNTRSKDGKDPYCEFVDGAYTFDIDLRRTVSYQGNDFDFMYFDELMKEVNSYNAEFLLMRGLGFYFDDNVHAANDIVIEYSSLLRLPEVNKIESANLNLLTSLQAERVIYLVKTGASYDNAVVTSRNEILKQIKYSEYFASLDLDLDKDFASFNSSSELLLVLTRALYYKISRAVKLSEDKSIAANVWRDFIDHYAFTGDIALSSLEPNDVFARDFVNSLSVDSFLKVSVSKYKIPFPGGVPQIMNNSIYYGVDTSSFSNKILVAKNNYFKIRFPKFKNLVTNGYMTIKADMFADSLSLMDSINIRVHNLDSVRKDTIYRFKKSSYDSKFSSLIWLNEEAKYKIDFILGKDSVSYEVNNKLSISIN